MENQQMYQNQMPAKKLSVNGLGIAGMVIGIISVLLSFTVVGLAFGIIGFTLSICGFIPKNTKYGMTIVGTVLCSVAMLLYFLIVICAPPKTNKEIKVSSINSETISPNETVQQSEGAQNDSQTDSLEEYPIGSIVETSDTKITFISCDDYEVDNDFLLPKDGYKYIAAEFEFENIGKTDTSISSWSFECYADGYSVEQSYVNDDDISATISSGRKAKGSVTFEVPENAAEIVIEYSPNMFSSNKLKFVVE